ncbi:hypothetical protein I7I48_03090 [Histoplasma ohiense]|nr:hypothetical protein I7I48_03090 [Histoplasma ohiense (nom. inval.)]
MASLPAPLPLLFCLRAELGKKEYPQSYRSIIQLWWSADECPKKKKRHRTATACRRPKPAAMAEENVYDMLKILRVSFYIIRSGTSSASAYLRTLEPDNESAASFLQPSVISVSAVIKQLKISKDFSGADAYSTCASTEPSQPPATSIPVPATQPAETGVKR